MKKLRLNVNEYITTLKQDLSENPTDRAKFYSRSAYTGLLYFEKRYYREGGLRFFFTVKEGVVIVANVEKQGTVNLDGVANKKTQKHVSKRLGLHKK
jgi:hypothetical protein